MYEYEDISNVDRAKAFFFAEEILKSGWVLRNYPVVFLDAEIPWALSSQEERSWNFHVHCWDMLDSLLKAHAETGDERFLVPSVRLALDWAEKHERSNPDVSPFAWYDMAVGLRAYRLAYILESAAHAGLLDTADELRLWQCLLQHQDYLADDGNIVFHNNHGYYQVAGQLAMGRRFAHKSELMTQAFAQAQSRLMVMLEQQFASDGVHREHSPDYHRMVYDTLRAMIAAGLVEDKQTIAFAERIEKALSWFVLPNQHIANFGDSDFRLLRRKPAEAERKWQTPEMQYMVTGGKIGQWPAERFAAFREGGYFVVRQAAQDAPGTFAKSSYLAQTAAFHSRTHKHADDLSFIWSDRGHDLLVDAGRYGYIGKAEQGSPLWLDGHWYSDPNRVYCESTRAHNTLEFDGLNYPRKGAKPYGSALKRWAEADSGIIAVETECNHFKSIRRSRLLVFKPAQWLLVFDWFHDNLGGEHDVRQWFHMAPHLQVNTQGDAYVVSVPGSDQPLRVTSLLPGATASRLHLGEEEPKQGWWSSKERDIVPNYAFCFEQSAAANGAFATLFSFSGQLQADNEWSKVNLSGRKGQFRWRDDAGVHKLRFERPEDGELQVVYSE